MKRKLLTSGLWCVGICAMMLMGTLNTSANNVVLSNVALNASTSTVSFNITWDNSWRNVTSAGTTQNFDGVWVFIKYRLCSDRPASGAANPGYKHAWLSTTLTDHTVSSRAALQIGTSLVPSIGGTPRGMGAFIYRGATDTVGTATYNGCILKWDMISQGLVGANLDILVNAIEMVYIPSGGFYAGDGNNGSSNRFGNDQANPPATAYLMNTENALTMNSYTSGTIGVGMWGAFTTGNGVTLPGPFPKGSAAFWCMKYEVTQEQYMTYLNSLSRNDQILHVQALFGTSPSQGTAFTNIYAVAGATTPTYRNGIRMPATPTALNSVIFNNDLNPTNALQSVDDGQTLACNYLSPADLEFYLDWAALAPMTELQYEKVCRGAGPTANSNEFVYGTGTTPANYTTILSGTAGQSNEIFATNPATTTPAVNYDGTTAATRLFSGTSTNGNLTTSGALLWGPTRVGQSFQAATTRLQAASSYYGVADMDGNVWEFCMAAGGVAAANTFNGQPGDGDVSTNSSPTVGGWPTGWDGFAVGIGGIRGGSFFTLLATLHTSDRSVTGPPSSGYAPTSAARDQSGGGRGVRN